MGSMIVRAFLNDFFTLCFRGLGHRRFSPRLALPLQNPPLRRSHDLASGVFSCIRPILADRKRRPAREVFSHNFMRVFVYFANKFAYIKKK